MSQRVVEPNMESAQGNSQTFDKQTCTKFTTTCPYCGVGCGVDADIKHTHKGAEIIAVQGTPNHPANFGKLCVKGSHLPHTNSHVGRMLQPRIQGQVCDWDAATDAVANAIQSSIDQYGPDSVAFYVSGQLLTEDYYVANKLMKGFIGSANIDTNSRLCMSSAVAAYKRAFGSDTVPCNYEDLEITDLLVFVGSNAAWTHPVIFQRIERAKALRPNTKIVFIDPRKTASCEIADLHLGLSPGSDVALFNGLLNYLHSHNALDHDFIDRYSEGFTEALNIASRTSIDETAKLCGLELDRLRQFYQWFASSATAVTYYSMGVNQSSRGVDKANSIINCHLATGKIGKPGSGPFSMTGQPNAMGGREVGGLANMLAAHMDIQNPEHRSIVSDFWQTSNLPETFGLKAIDMFDAMAIGKIKVVWIMATNPMVSMPNRTKIERALQHCDTVIVSDCMADNDTLRLADICLPATGWSEKDGTVTNSERRISRQRGMIKPHGQAKHDWQIICEVAAKLGHKQAFDYSHPAQIFAEHAALSGFRNQGSRDFDISLFRDISQQAYNELTPVQWPVNKQRPQGTSRMFEDYRFFTESGKSQFIATHFMPPVSQATSEFPFVVNSGRMRDQWHTMTRTGKSAELLSHATKSELVMHPLDAGEMNLKKGDLVAVESAYSAQSAVVLPVNLSTEVQRKGVFVPIHWNALWGSSSSINQLYGDSADPISGQPELKYTHVAIQQVHYKYFAMFMCSNTMAERQQQRLNNDLLNELLYWRKEMLGEVTFYTCAADEPISLSGLGPDLGMNDAQWLEKGDNEAGAGVGFVNKQLIACYYYAGEAFDVNTSALASLFNEDVDVHLHLSNVLRNQVKSELDHARQICSCFGVSENTIVKAIQSGIDTVDDLGSALKCGTNCGSCRPELAQLIASCHSNDKQTSDAIAIKEIS